MHRNYGIGQNLPITFCGEISFGNKLLESSNPGAGTICPGEVSPYFPHNCFCIGFFFFESYTECNSGIQWNWVEFGGFRWNLVELGGTAAILHQYFMY